MAKVKVVVTGAGGGIGSRLAARLVADGYEVVGLDRKPPHEPGNFPWVYADLVDRDAVMRHLEGAQAVLHLGEIPNVWGPFSPDEVFAQNTRVASTVFQACAYLGIERIVYASTAQTYGCYGDSRVPPRYVPVDETHEPNPQNGYSASKVANEAYLRMVAGQTAGMSATALRIPGVIGLWWPWERFVERMHAHKDDRDGLGTYIHVDDVCDAFALVLASEPNEKTRVYNVVADDIHSLTPTQDYLEEVWPGLRLPEGFPEFGSWLSAERIKRELGWSPKYSAQRTWREMHAEAPAA